jgi:RNA polymerase sigma factor (TIGR02999 family)
MDRGRQQVDLNAPEDLPHWLDRARTGDREALDRLTEQVYGELRRIAGGLLKSEPDGLSLQATEIANAVYIRLAGTAGLTFENRACFLGLAATAMRHFLTDYAKAKRREKRGGGERPIPLEEALFVAERRNIDVEALGEALADLERLNPRHARVIEHRVFGGLSVEESAAALDVSPTTVKRDFDFAKKWLRRRLRESPDAR